MIYLSYLIISKLDDDIIALYVVDDINAIDKDDNDDDDDDDDTIYVLTALTICTTTSTTSHIFLFNYLY
jgi:hypothetical protein